VGCNDTVGNMGTSNVYYFLVDTTYPLIEFVDPTPLNDTLKNEVVVNVSSSDNLGEHSVFVDWDNSLVGWWRMEQENGTFFEDESSGHCYDNETEILTENGWKYFKDLEDEKVMTLNQETGEKEWQTPTEKQEFENNKEMYKIVLEDSSDLLVSEKHKVYTSINKKDDLVGFIVMPESVKDNYIIFKLKHQNKTSNMNSFVVIEVSLEILKMLKENNITVDNLGNLFSDSDGKSLILMSQLIELLSQNRSYYKLKTHFNPINLSNSSKVMGLILPDLSFAEVSSIDLTTSLAIDSLISRESSSEISDISLTLFNNLSLITSFNVSANALLATDDQLIKSVSSILSFNSSGTDNVIVPILDLQSKYLYYVYTKDIFKPFVLEDFNLTPITEAYSDFNSGKELYFLDGNNEEIKVLDIVKEEYNGKIYDVDVPNDIVLVRRKSPENLDVMPLSCEEKASQMGNDSCLDSGKDIEGADFGVLGREDSDNMPQRREAKKKMDLIWMELCGAGIVIMELVLLLLVLVILLLGKEEEVMSLMGWMIM
jgi:hypothetical protein